MERPSTLAAYVDLIDQACFEVAELRSTVEYDAEAMGDARVFLETLEQEIKALRTSLREGTYQWGYGKKDLPFMSLVESASDRLLPFKSLLRILNYTHRQGLDVRE